MQRLTKGTRLNPRRWTSILGAVLSVTVLGMGLRFGLAGLAGSLAIALFAVFVGAVATSGARPLPISADPGGSQTDPLTHSGTAATRPRRT